MVHPQGQRRHRSSTGVAGVAVRQLGLVARGSVLLTVAHWCLYATVLDVVGKGVAVVDAVRPPSR